jgi:hypothetical protein
MLPEIWLFFLVASLMAVAGAFHGLFEILNNPQRNGMARFTSYAEIVLSLCCLAIIAMAIIQS